MKFTIDESELEQTYILEEDLISSHTRGFEDELNNFIQNDNRDILLDLTQVTKIDSISIALLLRIKSRLTENGRTVRLTRPNETVMRILELAGLQDFLLD